MKRLTERVKNCADPKEIYGVWVKDHDYIKAANRLADYEDIADEVGGFDCLREFVEANKVLPCKVGDTVWTDSGRIVKCEIYGMYLSESERIEYFVSFNCKGADCDKCSFNCWIQTASGKCYCESECGCGTFKDNEIGNTVFLTKAEAEKALKAM